MLKKLKTSASLIIIGEILSWAVSYFSNNDISNFSEFTSGVLLGISIGIKLIGIVLLIISIVKYSGKEIWKQSKKNIYRRNWSPILCQEYNKTNITTRKWKK